MCCKFKVGSTKLVYYYRHGEQMILILIWALACCSVIYHRFSQPGKIFLTCGQEWLTFQSLAWLTEIGHHLRFCRLWLSCGLHSYTTCWFLMQTVYILCTVWCKSGGLYTCTAFAVAVDQSLLCPLAIVQSSSEIVRVCCWIVFVLKTV